MTSPRAPGPGRPTRAAAAARRLPSPALPVAVAPPTRCPTCQGRLYDPGDVELVACCLFCGEVIYSDHGRSTFSGPGGRRRR